MLDYDSFMQILDSVKSHESDPCVVYLSPKTCNRLLSIGHMSKARLWETQYKRRKCFIRRLSARRQAARKRYGA